MAGVTRRNIYLAGFMGTGKSTVGRELARLMGRKFVDTDVMLERQLGMNVNEVFTLYGEQFFRQRERDLALALSRENNRVIATGGGTLLDRDVYKAFNSSGLIICLFTAQDPLVARLERSDKRPLLKGVDLKNSVEQLMAQRKEVYDRISVRVDTTNLTPQEAARKICDLLKVRQNILDKLESQYIVIS